MYEIEELCKWDETKFINHRWVKARPINYQYRTFRQRISEAWQVFVGKADACIWPEGQ